MNKMKCPFCEELIDANTTKCPFCAEELHMEMIKCPFCAEDVPANTKECPFCSEILTAVPPPVAGTFTSDPQTCTSPGYMHGTHLQQHTVVTVNVPQNNTVQNTKSNAPLLCGIIATVLIMPSLFFASLCAGVCSSEAKLIPGQDTVTEVLVFYICSILVCFICSFGGKAKHSAIYGTFMILASIVVIIASFITFNIIFGLGAGILYLIGGVMACINQSRP